MSQSNNLVTVLMPAYNPGKYLPEAIESILAQTYSNFEFLIINDGSTDNTLNIINSYKDPRIRVISRENKGLIDTLNEGIDAAAGELIARMDADDICFPERLEKQVQFFLKHPDHVLVGAEANVVDKDGKFLFKLTPVGYTHEEIAAGVEIKCPFNHPSVMFRKEAVIKAGYYPKSALTFEDHLLWKKMLTVGKVANMHEVLVNYRFNPESVTIDEKWRGKRFIEIRKKAIYDGFVSEEDGQELQEIIRSQNFGAYRKASYYALVGKKYLWDNPDSALARKNLAEAIQHYPKNIMSYALYLFSYLPTPVRKGLYRLLKKEDR